MFELDDDRKRLLSIRKTLRDLEKAVTSLSCSLYELESEVFEEWEIEKLGESDGL